jgi:hypothetical protein
MTGRMAEQRSCSFGTDGVLIQQEVALQSGEPPERAYYFAWEDMPMHREESFDMVSCRGLGHARGE